jgi:F-type H+-transporting ATPase subunit alpha
MLDTLLHDVVDAYGQARRSHQARLHVREIGTVVSIDEGIAVARGLPEVSNEEIVSFSDGSTGLVLELHPDRVAIALLDDRHGVQSGTMVTRTGRVLDTPVGESLLGRVVDPLGRPLDQRGAIDASMRLPVERPAPSIMMRGPIVRPLHTGITAIDAMIPIGRGQRELLLGDRQTGKTAVAVDTILHQRHSDVISIYCAIGQQSSEVARVHRRLRESGALERTVIVVAEGEQLPGLRFVAPYTAMSIGEYFAERGRDVLVVFDDLTQHAQSYRELALLLRRPPGREAFPGDIFYVHSRLLERATQLRREFGGGSLTAIPIVETEAQDISAYIPTNIVSITDGQIYLSPDLFQKGFLPAIDVGQSVSRVGGKAQLPTYRSVSGRLKLLYSQFAELEQFARFGTRMDEETRRALERGRRVRELLKQPQFTTYQPAEQIAMLFAVSEELLEHVPIELVDTVARRIRDAVAMRHRDWAERVEAGDKLEPADNQPVKETITDIVEVLEAEVGAV